MSPAEDVRAFTLALLAAGQVTARADGSVHELAPVAIGEAQGEALRRIVVAEGATSTIDVGLGYGIASLFMCAGLLETAGASHVAIDPFQASRYADAGVQNLEDAGVLPLVEVVREPSELALPDLLRAGSLFDVAFLDGNHRFDWMFVDLVFLGRLLKPGGVVVVDDDQLRAVHRAVSFVMSNLGWTVEASSKDDPLHHWVALRTSTGTDDRAYDSFVDF